MKSNKIKLILLVSMALFLLFTSLNSYSSYMKLKKTVEETIANQSLEAAISIASVIDTETYQQFLNNPVENEHYWNIRNFLNDARIQTGSLFVYTLKIDNPKLPTKVQIVGTPNGDNSHKIGDTCTVPERQVKRAYEGNTYVTSIIHDPEYGAYISVGAPIKDKEGKVIGFLGIDVSAEKLKEIEQKVLENNVYLFIYNAIFILIVIVSFYFINRWYQKEVSKEVGYTEDTYQAEIKNLIASVSSLQHDFTNHIQVLNGFLQLGESEQAEKYAASLFKEVRAVQSLSLNFDHIGLSILLQTKKIAAQNHNIEMDFKVSNDTFHQIKTTDLIIILSNLIDNAIDAVIELPEDERKIKISCEADDTHYEFKITNTGVILRNELIFEQGYSTKKSVEGKIRGQGLFIVKEVVNKYSGNITIKSMNKFETTAIVIIPLKYN